jgi:hypothetical protein
MDPHRLSIGLRLCLTTSTWLGQSAFFSIRRNRAVGQIMASWQAAQALVTLGQG